MSNCNCKKDKNGVEIKGTTSIKKEPLVVRGIILLSKSILFLFGSLIATIIVIPFSIYMLFKIMFLDEGLDVTGGLLSIGKLLKKKEKEEDDEDDDDEDEYEFEDEDELVLLNTQ